MSVTFLRVVFLFFLAFSNLSYSDAHLHSHDSNSGLSIMQKRKASSIGMGLAGLADWSTQHPFLDQMKLSRDWYDWRRKTDEGIELDSHGWVVSLADGARAETVFLTTPTQNPIIYKSYIVRWQGKGEITYGGCAKKVADAYGGHRISVGYRECFLIINSVDRRDPITNITIVPEKHLAAFDRGEVFNPDFIEKIGVFRALRYMDWMKTNGSSQRRWSDRPLVNDRSYAIKGIPVELMILLANTVKADPWFNMPHQSDMAYIHNFAKVVKKYLHSDLVAIVEHSNEIWNWVFPQARFALEVGKNALGDVGDAHLQWHGMRTAQICNLWKQEVFAAAKARVNCVIGVQAGWLGAEKSALDCPLWVAKGNKPCYQYGIDSVAIAGYFSGCLDGNKDPAVEKTIVDWAGKGREGLYKAYEQVLDARHFQCAQSLPRIKERYRYHVAEAKKRGLDLVAYEGGQHITSNLSNTQKNKNFIDFHIAINRSQYMRDLYRENFEGWINEGGGLFMHYVDVTDYNQYGSWGALEYITQPASVKWDAIIELNSRVCWWEGCK